MSKKAATESNAEAEASVTAQMAAVAVADQGKAASGKAAAAKDDDLAVEVQSTYKVSAKAKNMSQLMKDDANEDESLRRYKAQLLASSGGGKASAASTDG